MIAKERFQNIGKMSRESKGIMSEKTKQAISRAMKKNKNAQKWTKEIVLDILQHMMDNIVNEEVEHTQSKQEEEAETPKGAVTKEVVKSVTFKPVLKIDLLIACKIWNRNWFFDMKQKFQETIKDNEGNEVENPNYCPSVFGMVQAIDMMTESNLVNASLSGKVNNSIATLVMNKHGYVQKTEVKQDNDTNVKFGDIPVDDAAKEAYERAKKNMKTD